LGPAISRWTWVVCPLPLVRGYCVALRLHSASFPMSLSCHQCQQVPCELVIHFWAAWGMESLLACWHVTDVRAVALPEAAVC
jgi:hypothetical protein